MTTEPKKPELSDEDLDGVSGGQAPPEPEKLRRGIDNPNIQPGFTEPPEPDKIGLPPGPCKPGH
jgi:hypothetical protein